MLQSMRGRTASYVTKILFVILALSFVTWGVEGFVTNINAVPPVLVVGKVELDGTQVTARINRNLVALQRSLNTKLDRNQMMQLGLYDQALDRLIGELLIDQESQKLGLKVGDDTLRIILRASPGLLKPDGSVDAAALQQVAEASGYGNPSAFLAYLRTQIASGSLLRALALAPAIPPIMEDGIAAFKFEQRRIAYAVLPDGSGAATQTPDATKIAAYQQEHAQDFTAPEQRKLSYAILTPGQLLAQISLSEDELKTIYGQRKLELSRPERRVIEQISFDSEEEAKSARAKLSGKTGFADLAKAKKLSPKDYQLGWVAVKDLPPDLSTAAFAVKEGEISPPVKTEFGYSLVRATKIEAAVTPSFEQVHDRLLAETKINRATDLMYENSNKIETLIDGGANLAKFATQFGLTVAKLPALTADGLAVKPTDKIALDKDLLKAIVKAGFDLKSGETSRPIEMREQNLYLFVHADEVTQAALRPVPEVASEIIARIKADEARTQGEARAKDLLAAITTRGNFADGLKNAGYTLVTSPWLDRNGRGSDGKNYDKIDVALLSDLFKADAKGAAVIGRSPDNKAWIIAQVTEINQATANLSDKDRNAIAQELGRNLQTDLIEQYINGLKSHYKIEVDRKAFAKLF